MDASENDMPELDSPGGAVAHFARWALPWVVRGFDLLTVVMVAGAVMAIGNWAIPLPSGASISGEPHVLIPQHGSAAVADLPPGVEVVGHRVDLPDPAGLVDYLLRALYVLPGVAMLIFVVLMLRAVVRSVSRGEPFTQTNAIRVSVMGLGLSLGAPCAYLISLLAEQVQVDRAGLTDVIATVDLLSLAYLVLGGLLLVILGGVFQTGVRMRDDVEGLV